MPKSRPALYLHPLPSKNTKATPKKKQATVEIRTHEGKVYSQRLDGFRGEPEWPLTRKEIEAKFMDLASGVIGKQKAEEAVNFISSLEKKNSIQEMGSLWKRGGL